MMRGIMMRLRIRVGMRSDDEDSDEDIDRCSNEDTDDESKL